MGESGLGPQCTERLQSLTNPHGQYLFRHDFPVDELIRGLTRQKNLGIYRYWSAQLKIHRPFQRLWAQSDWVIPAPRQRSRWEAPSGLEEILRASQPQAERKIREAFHKTAVRRQHERGFAHRCSGGLFMALREDFHFSGKRVLLIDDVHTSGTTLAQAETLALEAGAKSVELFTLSRAFYSEDAISKYPR